jgi:competence protein ComEC
VKAVFSAIDCLRSRLGLFLRRAPLLFCLFAGLSAVVAVDRGFTLATVLVPLAILGLVLVSIVPSRSRVLLLGGGLVAMILPGTRHHERLAAIESFPFASALEQGQVIEVSGHGWIADTVVHGERSLTTTMEIETVALGGHVVPCDHRVPVWIQKTSPALSYGSRIEFTGRLLPLEGASTPGGFNAKEFYHRHSGSLARLEIREGDRFTVRSGDGGLALVAFAGRLRGHLEKILLLGLSEADEPYARIIAAMTLGARENSPEELEELFRISGTLHLFAVSGMHVGVVAGLLLTVALFLRLPRHYAVLAVIPCVLFYAVLTGLSPSAVRAAVMFSAFLAAYALREKPCLLNSLGFAGLIIVLADSQQLFLPGFQLSFLVVFFIALLTSGLHQWIARPFLADPFIPAGLLSERRHFLDKATGVLAASLAISISSWLGSVGLLAWHFQSVSLVAIVANVFMVPFAGVIITLASFSLFTGGIKLIWLAIAGNKVNVGITMALTGLAQFFASWPAAEVNTGAMGKKAPATGVLRLDLMGDRGDGAALLTVPRSGQAPLHWMIDSGGERTYKGQVLPLLRSRGINRLDALVLTHGDAGHIGAAPRLISSFRPPLLLESVLENRSRTYPAIVAAATSLGLRSVAVERPQRLVITDGAVATILAPAADEPGGVADDRGLVMKISYAGQSILLTSDTGFATANELLRSGADLRATVWVRGQHGEGTPLPDAFLEAVNPRVVLSSHADFPGSEQISKSFREALAERGVPLFEIGPSGTVSVELSQAGLRVIPYALPHETLSLSAP